MNQKKRYYIYILGLLFLVFISFFCGRNYGKIINKFTELINPREDNWDAKVSIVAIKSSLDGKNQLAQYYSTRSKIKKLLIISLHSWSGDYKKIDPIHTAIVKEDWNYIHPDFRGPNNNPDACLSELALCDIDDAISYAKENGNVDTEKVIIFGGSGGGMAALAGYLRTEHKLCATLSWAPISDIEAWYNQNNILKNRYSHDIELVVNGLNKNSIGEMRKRSPFFWEIDHPLNGRLEIYAGINDKTIPITHSIYFFNKIAINSGYRENIIDNLMIIDLLSKNINNDATVSMLGGRKQIYRNDAPMISLIVFEGGHEILYDFAIQRLKELCK